MEVDAVTPWTAKVKRKPKKKFKYQIENEKRDKALLSAPRPQGIEPISFTLEEACRVCGWTRTQGFQLVTAGLLKTYKLGRRRCVTPEALRETVAYLEKLTEEGRSPELVWKPQKKTGKPRKEGES